MKVRDLIETLEDMDPDADVFVAIQPEYPFECRLAGVCERGDYLDEDEADDEAEPWSGSDRWAASDSDLPKSDVLILAGDQVRYGAKAAWDAARGR